MLQIHKIILLIEETPDQIVYKLLIGLSLDKEFIIETIFFKISLILKLISLFGIFLPMDSFLPMDVLLAPIFIRDFF